MTNHDILYFISLSSFSNQHHANWLLIFNCLWYLQVLAAEKRPKYLRGFKKAQTRYFHCHQNADFCSKVWSRQISCWLDLNWLSYKPTKIRHIFRKQSEIPKISLIKVSYDNHEVLFPRPNRVIWVVYVVSVGTNRHVIMCMVCRAVAMNFRQAKPPQNTGHHRVHFRKIYLEGDSQNLRLINGRFKTIFGHFFAFLQNRKKRKYLSQLRFIPV